MMKTVYGNVFHGENQEHLQTYILKTVTYSTSCAPYLAVKSLEAVAKAEIFTWITSLLEAALYRRILKSRGK